jgi:hypothetical protein
MLALTAGLVLALVLMTIAVWQWRRAEGQRRVAERQQQVADHQRQVSLARQLAAQANFLLTEHPLMVERSVLLALESLKQEITTEGAGP